MTLGDGCRLDEGREEGAQTPQSQDDCFCSLNQPARCSSREREEAGYGHELGAEGTDEGCELTGVPLQTPSGSSGFFREHLLLGRHTDAVLRSSSENVKPAQYPAKAKSV